MDWTLAVAGDLTLLRWEDKRYFTQRAFKAEAEINNSNGFAAGEEVQH